MKVTDMGTLNEKSTGWIGWLGNEKEICFVKPDGSSRFHQRDPETRAVVGKGQPGDIIIRPKRFITRLQNFFWPRRRWDSIHAVYDVRGDEYDVFLASNENKDHPKFLTYSLPREQAEHLWYDLGIALQHGPDSGENDNE